MKNSDIFMRFDSIKSFDAYINTTPTTSTFSCCEDALLEDEATFDFTKTKTYNDANNLLLYGDKELARKIEASGVSRTRRDIKRYIQKRQLRSAVVGFAPNVPAYLSGAPNCMITQNMIKVKQKVVTIAYNCGVCGDVLADNIIEAASRLLSAILIVEASGMRVNLLACTNGQSDYKHGQHVTFVTNIKSAGQPLDVLKCAYPIAHPSFNRRHKFRFIEVTKGVSSRWRSGYGVSETNDESTKEILTEHGVKVDFVFNYQSLKNLSTNIIVETLTGAIK